MDQLNKLSQNRRASQESGNCQKILGSEASVLFWADLWRDRADEIALITTSCLLDFCTDEKNLFNSDEAAAYRKGLGEIGKFVFKCAAETGAKEALRKIKEKSP